MKKLTLIAALAATMLMAEDVTPLQTQVKEMIQAIQAAPEGERYQKMNEFKMLVKSMNQEQRQEAIGQLQAAMPGSGDMLQTQTRTQDRTQAQDGTGEGDMTKTQTRDQERLHEMQDTQMQQQMQQRQQMKTQQVIQGGTTGMGSKNPQHGK